MILYFLFFLDGLLLHINLVGCILITFILIIFAIKKRKSKYQFILLFTFLLIGIVAFKLATIKGSEGNISSIFYVKEAKNNYLIVSSSFKKYYIYIENNNYQKFDLIYIEGKVSELNFTTYESQLDFNQYLTNKGCYFQIQNSKISDTFLIPIRLSNIRGWLLKPFSEETKKISYKLLFNYSYDKDWENIIYKNNLSYIFFASTYHLFFIIEICERILKRKYQKKKIQNIILCGIIFIYPLMNFKKSILKLFLYKLFSIISERNEKVYFSQVDKISLSWGIILFLDPTYILDRNFWISIGVAFYIYFLSLSVSYIKKKYRGLYFSFCLFIFMIPFWISNNGTFTFLSVFFTFFFGPIILCYLLILLVSSLIRFPYVTNFLSSIITKLIYGLTSQKIVLNIGSLSIFEVFIYYIFLVLIIVSVEKKVFKRIYLFGCFQMIVLLVSSLPLQNSLTYEVDFINVGQGDSIVIRNGLYCAMIDTGGVLNIDLASESLIPFLVKNKIKRIDTLFITHDDYDHCGAKESLMTNFHVSKVVGNSFSYYELGNMTFINLNCNSNFVDENDKSLVIYLELYDKKFLFMGDASTKVEKNICDEYPTLRCDYLKIGHHGSNTSTSEAFLDLVKPKEAIISVGKKNKYGHPNESVISLLESKNIKIRRTDEEGTIKIKGSKIKK